jgi:hypothetical protein
MGPCPSPLLLQGHWFEEPQMLPSVWPSGQHYINLYCETMYALLRYNFGCKTVALWISILVFDHKATDPVVLTQEC